MSSTKLQLPRKSGKDKLLRAISVGKMAFQQEVKCCNLWLSIILEWVPMKTNFLCFFREHNFVSNMQLVKFHYFILAMHVSICLFKT